MTVVGGGAIVFICVCFSCSTVVVDEEDLLDLMRSSTRWPACLPACLLQCLRVCVAVWQTAPVCPRWWNWWCAPVASNGALDVHHHHQWRPLSQVDTLSCPLCSLSLSLCLLCVLWMHATQSVDCWRQLNCRQRPPSSSSSSSFSPLSRLFLSPACLSLPFDDSRWLIELAFCCRCCCYVQEDAENPFSLLFKKQLKAARI